MGRLSDFKYNQKNDINENVSEEQIKEKFNEYKDLSHDELSNELFKEVARQKNQGTFDYQKLNSMVESLKGALPEESFNNMKRILESLK